MGSNASIKGLGEIALRVNDLEQMAGFYEHVIGLERWQDLPDAVFFRIADGFEGHTRVLALFDRRERDCELPRSPTSTLDHFAFEISLSDYESELRRLEGLGLDVRTREFPVFSWRGMFVKDPEGNTVELVCYDEDVST